MLFINKTADKTCQTQFENMWKRRFGFPDLLSFVIMKSDLPLDYDPPRAPRSSGAGLLGGRTKTHGEGTLQHCGPGNSRLNFLA